MILNKIKQFFLKNKKEILFFSFLAIFIFSIGDTFADDKTKDGMSSLIEGINFFLKIFSTIIGLMSSLVALLLNPGWVNGTIFGFDVYLKDIWILISNIVYFAFAFILIIIAFMNIVGQGGGTWELKSALPKFVVGVVMVPFTWFFVQFILSISAFLTVAVLSLPYDTMNETDVFKGAENFRICKEYVFYLESSSGSTDSSKQIEECTKNTEKSISVKNLLEGKEGAKGASSSIFSIINIYTYGIMKIQDSTQITKGQLTNGVKKLGDLTVKSIFDILFMIIFLIIMIALFMALFSRGVWLWIYAMFSPVFGLLFFFGKSKDGVNKISPIEFIKLAMVPVYVAAALAFGMIFIFVAAQGLTDTESGSDPIFSTGTLDDKKTPVSIFEISSITIKLVGIQGGATTTNSLFNSLGNGIGQLLLEIFGLVILWIAVMAALKSSEITHNVVKPIISFGESIGSLVAKAPQYAPIIPTPNGMTSATGLQYGSNSIISEFQTNARNKSAKNVTSMFGGGNKVTDLSNDTINRINTLKTVKDKKIISNIREAIKSSKDSNDLASNTKFKELMNTYGDKLFEGDKKGLTHFQDELKKGTGDGVAKALFLADKKADSKSWSKEYTIYNKDSTSGAIGGATKTSLDKYIKEGKESKNASNAAIESRQAEKNLTLSNIGSGIYSTNGKITRIGTINITAGKIDSGKYKKVAFELYKNDNVKKLSKLDFKTEFKGYGLEEVDEIWKEIEKLKNPTT